MGNCLLAHKDRYNSGYAAGYSAGKTAGKNLILAGNASSNTSSLTQAWAYQDTSKYTITQNGTFSIKIIPTVEKTISYIWFGRGNNSSQGASMYLGSTRAHNHSGQGGTYATGASVSWTSDNYIRLDASSNGGSSAIAFWEI